MSILRDPDIVPPLFTSRSIISTRDEKHPVPPLIQTGPDKCDYKAKPEILPFLARVYYIQVVDETVHSFNLFSQSL